MDVSHINVSLSPLPLSLKSVTIKTKCPWARIKEKKKEKHSFELTYGITAKKKNVVLYQAKLGHP